MTRPIRHREAARALALPALLLAGFLLALLALPSRAAAQCGTDAICQASQPPVVWTEPRDTSWSGTTATAQLVVTIHWCGPYSVLDADSRQIWLDGDSVTANFSWQLFTGQQQVGSQHCMQHAISVDTLTLSSGVHQLEASIARANDPETVGQRTVTFTYTNTAAPAGPDLSRRTNFSYYPMSDPVAPGMLRTVEAPLVRAESFTYDARGNLATQVSPAQLTTTTVADALGRVSSVTQPGGAQKLFTYDAADRVVEEESYGPARTAHSSFAGDSTYSAEHLWVHTWRNAAGQPDSVGRWQSPDPGAIGRIVTRWRYDLAGRAVVEIAPDATPTNALDNPRDSTVFDPAGNPTDVFTRRGFHLIMRYDTLGRLTQRITPPATSTLPALVLTDLSPTTTYFPYFGQDAQGNFTLGTAQQSRAVTVPADTATFGYDAMGNLKWANNRSARVSRTWYPNGSMASETQRIRAYASTDTLAHTYRLDFRYDLDGRRTGLIHPGSISPSAPARDSTGYTYDPVTGALATIAGVGGYLFEYDAAGRVKQLTRTGTRETFAYDLGGRMYDRHDWSGNTEVHHDVTSFDPATGEMTLVNGLRETVLQARRGLGALAWVDSYNSLDGTRNVEYYTTDPLANQYALRMEPYGATQIDPSPLPPEATVHTYEQNTGRLLSTANAQSVGPYELSSYDVAGNQTLRRSIQTVGTPYTGYDANGTNTSNVAAPLRDETGMYYGADDRLYVADRRSCLHFQMSGAWRCDTTRVPAYEKRSAFEEYRYDALGRRVLVRTRSEYACMQLCLNTLRRTVWDGDQVLYEISAPGGSTATAAQMEADTGIATPLFRDQNGGVNVFFPYGRVLYEHGGGIDAPLGVVRMEYSDTLRDAQVILPHADWSGSYARGTTIGSCFVYGTHGTFLLPPPDSTPSGGDGTRVIGGAYDGSAEHCINVDWPAAYTWSARQYRRGYDGPVSWMGSLIYESRDASGLYYRRNRYYDSEKGRFTQEDPIGLAGGVNAYGFANGDPVSYDDPLGLMVCFRGRDRTRLINATKNGTNTTFSVDTRGCIDPSSIQPQSGDTRYAALQKTLTTLANDAEVHMVGFVDADHPCPGMGSCTFGTNDTRVSLADLMVRYPTCDRQRYPTGWRTSLEQTVVHELLGHQTDGWFSVLFKLEGHALRVENLYHQAAGDPKRCGHGSVINPNVPQR